MSLDTLISNQKIREQEEEISKETILKNIDNLRKIIAY